MIRIHAVAGNPRVTVVFSLPPDRVGGAGVSVVGDFNGWDPRPHPLRLSPDGSELIAQVTLRAGARYAFRYRTERGDWFNDDRAHGSENNGMGTENSILDLSDWTPPQEAAQHPAVPGPAPGRDPLPPAETAEAWARRRSSAGTVGQSLRARVRGGK